MTNDFLDTVLVLLGIVAKVCIVVGVVILGSNLWRLF